MKRLILLCLTLCLAISSFGQTQRWIVIKPAILHQSSNSTSAGLGHLDSDTVLRVLPGGLTNNYYHVSVAGQNSQGWIYKNYIAQSAVGEVMLTILPLPALPRGGTR